MAQELIFLPMLGTMALTAVVWVYMYARRIPAMRRAGVHVQSYTTRDSVTERLPEDVNYAASNLQNLFELPVLYYGLCLYLFVSGNVDFVYVVTAWLFLGFRVLHSIVHCTRNIVLLRFYLHVAGALTLWVMLGRALLHALSVYF